MDPKQKEGQNNSGTLSTGANISRTMDSFNNRKSATSNSPFAKHQFNKVAPQTGDILLSPSNNYVESKKGFSINRGRLIQFGLIFGAVALVALVIVTVVLVINKPKDNTKVASVTSYQEAYNRYANWMINGTESTTKADTSTSVLSYKLEELAKNGENQIDFLQTAREYFGEFATAFYQSNLSSYNTLTSIVLSNEANLNFYLGYLETADLTTEDLVGMYSEYGNNLHEELDKIYNNLKDNSFAAEEYADMGLEYSNVIQAWLNALSNASCIVRGGIDDNCRRKLLAESTDANDLYGEVIYLQGNMADRVTVVYNKILLNVRVIDEELSQPTQNVIYENEDTYESEVEDNVDSEVEE